MLIPTRIQGLAVDHSCVRITLPFGEMFYTHCKSVTYDDSLQPSENMGTHPIPLPRGLGQYKANASMVIVADAWRQFLSKAPDGYGALVFPVVIDYIPRGAYAPSQDIWYDASIISVKNSSGQGQGGLDIELGFYLRWLTRDGKCLVPVDIDITPSLGG